MKFVLYSPFFLEEFDHNTPLHGVGIGGSETAQIETATRLATRGNKVFSYMPIPQKEGYAAEGVSWRHCDTFNPAEFDKDTVFIVYRYPDILDRTDWPRRSRIMFNAQDCDYTWSQGRIAKIDNFLCLCPEHCQFTLKKYPDLKGRIHNFSNGVRRDYIEKIEKEGIKRDPKKILYASSPDRGLALILQDWFRVKERCPDAKLTVAYGFDNAEKILARGGNPSLAPLLQNLKELMGQKDITWLGRVNQDRIYREWFSSGLWWYPTDWPETSCITSLDAQACGAIPVTNRHWALKQNVLHGVCLDGIPEQDGVCRMSLINELCNLLNNPAEQELYRAEMMLDARDTFDWDIWVERLEKLCL